MGLSRVELWTILAIGIAVFVFAGGPIWLRPFTIDGAIIWSYVAVVVLGLTVLAFRGRLTLRTGLLSSLELVLLKFVATLVIAVALWTRRDPPPPTPALIPQTAKRVERPVSVIQTHDRGTIRGRVTQDGAAVAHALVFVEHGLEALVFSATTSPTLLSNDGHGLRPELAVVEVGQPLILETTDGQLHALGGRNEAGETALNLPMVARGRTRPYVPDRPLGLVTLRCRVHEAPAGEAPSRLLILAHPFHTWTDDEGRFALLQVPAGALTVRALGPEGVNGQAPVVLAGGQQAEAALALAPPAP